MNRNSLLAILVFVILIGPVGYTLGNALTVPGAINLKVSSEAFSREILNTGNASGGYLSLNGYNSSLSALAYQNFSVGASKASFGFSLHYNNRTMSFFPNGNMAPFVILVTETSQSMGFPYYGKFALEIDTVELTAVLNVNGTGISDTGDIQGGITHYYNTSVAGYFFSYAPKIPFTTINRTIAYSNQMEYASSYTLDYSIQVTPVVEFGPYHFAGSATWVSHTFQYPLNGQ